MKRLNIKLLVWLIVTPIVLAIGIHFLHAYQIDQNAGTLKGQAEEAKKFGKTEEAIKQYTQYLKHRPEDQPAYRELATLTAEAADKPEATRMQLYRAMQVMEETVRRHPELSDIRRRLVDYFMRHGRFRDATDHIDRLRSEPSGAKDAALDVKYALCLQRTGQEEKAVKLLSEAIGYDPVKQEFKPGAARGASEVNAYVLLAEIYRRNSENSTEAEAVINQLVKANPKLAKAYLERAHFYQRQKKFDLADKDLVEAVKMAPKDAEVLLTAADIAANLKQFDRAQTFLETGVAENPDNEAMYRALSALALKQKKLDAATKYIEDGLKRKPDSPWLLVSHAEIDFQKNDLDGVRQTIAKMRTSGFRPELIDLMESRILLSEGKFVTAARSLERLRPLMAETPDQIQNIDMWLGQAYLAQGQPDRAADAFRRALDTDPSSVQANLGHASALSQLGKSKEAAIIMEGMRNRAGNTGQQELPMVVLDNFLKMELAKQVAKPADQRDWREVDHLVEQVMAAGVMKPVQQAVLKAEIAIFKGDFKSARSELKAARKIDPKEISVYIAMLNLVNQEKDSDEKPEDVLTFAEKELGPAAVASGPRLNIAMRKDDPKETKAEIAKLEDKSKKLPDSSKTAFMSDLGNSYYRLRDYENARRCWLEVIKSRPDDSKTLLSLFVIAQEFGDKEDLNESLEQIRKAFGSSHPIYKFSEADKTVWQVKQKIAEPSALATARKQLEEARKLRPEWHEIARLSGDINVLDGRIDDAIADYQRTLELGPANPQIARRLIELLNYRGRFDEISKAMESVGPIGSGDPLEKVRIGLKLAGNNVDRATFDEALADAKKVVDNDPKDAGNQLWYAQLLARAGRDDEAIEAYRTTVEKDPKMSQAWLMLINQLVQTKQMVEAQEAIREAKAEGKVEADQRDAFLARAYEIVKDTSQAEDHYLAMLKKKPKDLGLMRGLAMFYLRSNQAEKGIKQAEKILALPAASDPKASDADKSHVMWARRAMAENLAGRGDYRSLQDALKLIEANKVDGKAQPDDLLLSADFLAKRPEHSSKLQALKLMEQVQDQRQLTPEQQFAMALLYDQTGDWGKARESIVNVLTKAESNPRLALEYAQMLLRHDELGEAERWVAKVEETQPNALSAVELRARMLAKQGKADQAKELLLKVLENTQDESARAQLLSGVATMLEEFNQMAAAEELLRDSAEKYSRTKLQLGVFLGRRGNLDEAFALFEESRKSYPLQAIIQVGLETLRRRSLEASKQQFAQVDGWIKSALADEKDSLRVNLQQAELRDIQGQTDEVISIYRRILEQKDLDDRNRAIVDNNLAFVLALTGKPADADEALKLIDRAISVLGPSSDLLDTRAICLMAQGDTKQALEDLRSAIVEAPSAVKYLHLAQAELKAGNKAAAASALEKARELKLDLNSLAARERENYKQLTQQLKSK